MARIIRRQQAQVQKNTDFQKSASAKLVPKEPEEMSTQPNTASTQASNFLCCCLQNQVSKEDTTQPAPMNQDVDAIVASKYTEESGITALDHRPSKANKLGSTIFNCRETIPVNSPTAQLSPNEAEGATSMGPSAPQWPATSSNTQSASDAPSKSAGLSQTSESGEVSSIWNPVTRLTPQVDRLISRLNLSKDELRNETNVNDFNHYLVSEMFQESKVLEDKLAIGLDRTPNRAIKDWEDFAYTTEVAAPLEVRLKCKLCNEKSCTMMLLEVLTAEHEDITVKDLMEALTRMKRHDITKIITSAFPGAANSSKKLEDFIDSRDYCDAVGEVATRLDQLTNNKNWFHLGQEFKVSSLRLKEIRYGQFTQFLMQFLYTVKTDLTILTFYEAIENNLKRPDVLNILNPFIIEEGDRYKLMADVITLESDTMRSICVALNNPNLTPNNWVRLAKAPELGIPDEVFKDCQPGKSKSPTKSLLKWIYASRTELTIDQLLSALKRIAGEANVCYLFQTKILDKASSILST